jgi:radical SAM superfamily enzyme YgiQ (UPF0313 family)
LCKKFELRTFANLMMGLPTESAAEMRQTYDLARALRAHAYVLSIAMPLPHTALWDLVQPQIAPEEYDRLNWHGDDFAMTDRCNKSLVPTRELIALHDDYTRKLQRVANLTTLATYHHYLATFMRLGNLFERIKFEVLYRLRQNRTILRTYLFLKSHFKLVGKINRFLKTTGASRGQE